MLLMKARPAFYAAPLLILLITSLLGVALSSCSGSPGLSAKEYVKRAKIDLDKGKLRDAIVELKNALQKDAKDPEARWLLGKAYVQVGDGPAAEQELKRAGDLGMAKAAIKVPMANALLVDGKFDRIISDFKPVPGMDKSGRARLLALRARAYLGKGQKDRAAEELRQARQLNGELPMVLAAGAAVAMTNQDLKKGRELAKKAVATDRGFADGWVMLGDVEMAADHPSAAEKAYSQAISQTGNPFDYVKRATARLASKDFDGAVSDAGIAGRLAPQYAKAFYVRGAAYFLKREFDQARTELENAVKLVPQYPQAVFLLGATHYMLGNDEQAVRYLQQTVSRFPRVEQARLLLGALWLKKNRLAEAAAMVEPVVRHDPKLADALTLLGDIYLAQGKTQNALEFIEKAVALEPDSSPSHLRFGIALLAGGETSKGLQELETAVRLDPENRSAEVALVVSAIRGKDYDKALRAAENFQKKQPQKPMPWDLKGLVYLAKKDEAKAMDAFQHALSVAPGDPAASANLATLARRKGDIKSARDYLKGVLKHHPDHLPTMLALAELDTDQKHMDKAKAWLEKAAEAYPDALAPHLLLAKGYLRGGRPEDALAALQDVAKDYPDRPDLLEVMGRAQLETGDGEGAVSAFKGLLQQRPKFAEGHVLLAKAYVSAGTAKPKQVEDELDKALTLDPENRPAKIALVRLLAMQKHWVKSDKLLTDLERKAPDNPDVLALQGWYDLTRGRPEASIIAYKKALKRKPESKSVLNLAYAQAQVGDRDEASKTLQDWLDDHPKDTKVRYALGDLAMARGQTERAKALFRDIVEAQPNNVLALNNLAWLVRGDDPAEALRYAERATQIAGSNPSVMDTLGMILVQQGDNARAVRVLTKASRQAPGNSLIGYHLALALHRDSKDKQAVKVLRRVLAPGVEFAQKEEALTLLRSLRGDTDGK